MDQHLFTSLIMLLIEGEVLRVECYPFSIKILMGHLKFVFATLRCSQVLNGLSKHGDYPAVGISASLGI